MAEGGVSEGEKHGPDWLREFEQQLGHGREPFVYAIDALRERFDVRQLPDGWLVLRRAELHPGSGWLYFAALRFAQSDVGGANELDALVFYGEGPGGKRGESLRECRHTYWGESGYIFYPDGKLITAALATLAEFYDDMVAA